MKSPPGAKALVCLKIAETRHHPSMTSKIMAREFYRLACVEFSEKAVVRKFEELVMRKYLECGVSARTAWLTPKGRAALDQALGIVRNPAVCQEALVKVRDKKCR